LVIKRVSEAGIFRALIALILVAAIISVLLISEHDPTILKIFLVLISGPITGALITARYQAQKKKQGNPKSVTVKGTSKSTKKLIGDYQEALQNDPHIAQLKILDMNRPLEIKNIYIRVRLHQETRPSFMLDATLSDATTGIGGDPIELLKANRSRIESRTNATMEPDEAIGGNFKHRIIVGDPGTGKTTLLKYLTLKSIKDQSTHLPDFPIYIELNAFASSSGSDLLEFAASLWEKRYNIDISKEVIINIMKDRLVEGKALLLLDALDETVIGKTKEESEESYLRVAKAINDLSSRYNQSPIIVTVRKASYSQRKHLNNFTELEIMDFRSKDIKQFVNNWFASNLDLQKRANVYDLLGRLERNPRIQALAANPLLLSLIIIVYEAQLDLPDRRSELYKQCVATLLTEWDKHRDIHRRSEFEPEQKKKLLEEVAWHFHLQGQCYFPEDELLTVIATFLKRVTGRPDQNQQILAEITAEHGLLKEQIKGLYGFLHLTLQEYFVALYAIDHNQLDTLLAHRGDSWWEEVVLLYAGSIPDVSLLLQKLLGRTMEGPLQEDFFNTNLILAGRSLASRPAFQKLSMRTGVINRLFDKLKQTKFSLTRERIANVLVEIGGTDVNYGLLPLFFNKQINPGVHQSIAEALCTQGEQSVAHDLLQRLADNQTDPNTCQNIAEVLGMIGNSSIALDLLLFFTNKRIVQDVDVRLSIVAALGMLGERSIAHTLLQQFSIERNPRIRQGIVEALGAMGELSIAPGLVQLLSTEDDPSVRGSIAYALGILGEKSVADALLQKLSIDKEENAHGRQCIAEALGTLGEHKVAQPLVHLISTEDDHSVQGSIAHALGVLGEKSVADALLQKLSSKGNAYMRQCIATALGMLGEESVIPSLQSLFSNEVDPSVRGSIAAALGKLGARSMIQELLQLLFTGRTDPIVCRRIADALSTLGERPSVLDLLRRLDNPQIDACVHGLLRQLANSQIGLSVRKRIATVLGTLDKNAAVPELLKLLSDQQIDPYVRERIAMVLEQIADDEETVRSLAILLEETDIIDSIHRTLWTVCRRTGVTIIRDTQTMHGGLKIVKWGNVPELQNNIISQQTRQAVPLSESNRTTTLAVTSDIVAPQFVVSRPISLPSHA
jgi:HEAT repeat protein